MAKYYKATMERGHVGCGYHNAYITFYYKCNNLIEAMQRAQRQGGVKHTRIPNCVEITKEEYEANIVTNAYVRAGAKLG